MAMNVLVRCPKCGMELEAPADLIGKPATCPDCSSQFVVSRDTIQPQPQEPESEKRSKSRERRSSSRITRTSVANPDNRSFQDAAEPPKASTPQSSSETAPQIPNSTATLKAFTPPGIPAESEASSPTARIVDNGNTSGASTSSGTAVFKGLPSESSEQSPPDQPADSASMSPNSSTTSSMPSRELADSAKKQDTGTQSTGTKKRRKSKSIQRKSESRKGKAAKIVEGGSIATRIQLGQDGTLPQLVVSEIESKKKAERDNSSSSPIMLIGVLASSVLVSVAMLFVPSGSDRPSQDTYQNSLQHLRENYLGQEPIREYQRLLRIAVQHENRGDRGSAKRIYRVVLDQMHQEGLDQKVGLSGPRHAYSPPNDEDLEKHLHILLRTGD